MAYTRPKTFIDGDNTKPADAAALHAMQDGVYSQAAAYTDAATGGAGGAVQKQPAVAQVVIPTTAGVIPLAVQSHAASTAGAVNMEGRDTSGATSARLYKEGTFDVFTGNPIFPSYRAFNGTADTQPAYQVTGSGVTFGAGGTTATDMQVARQPSYTDPFGVTTGGSAVNRPALKLLRTAGNEPVPVVVDQMRVTPSASTTLNTKNIMPLYVELNQNTTTSAGGTAAIKAFSVFTKTDGNALTPYNHGIESYVQYGSGTQVSQGTGHAFTGIFIVQGATAASEHCMMYGQLSYDTNNASTQGGRAWMTDWALHGHTGQQSLLSGINFVINNRYNGSPSASPSYGFGMMTSPNTSAGGGHPTGSTFPVDVGFWVGGQSNGTDGVGYYTAFKVGMGTHPRTGAALTNAFGWNFGASTVQTGIDLDDYTKYGIHLGARQMPGSAVGPQAIRTETTAGPSYFRGGLAADAGGGAPSASRYAPMGDGLLYVDNTSSPNRLYVFSGGAWKSVAIA